MDVYLINVHLTGVHLTNVDLMGVQHLMGVHLMGVHLIDVYFMDVCMLNLIFQIQKGFWVPHISHRCEDRLRLSSCDLSALSGVCFAIRAASIFDAVGAYQTFSSLL